jgi:hypothetical protein
VSRRRKVKDPRKLNAGGIVGPGGPFDENAVVVDASEAVLLEHVNVCLVEAARRGVWDDKPALAMALEGRINQSSDRAEITYFFNEDGAAALISQLVGLAVRIGPEFAERLMERLADLPVKDGD